LEFSEFLEKYEVKEPIAKPTNGALSTSASYSYIDKLIFKPISDGRHRVLWLILAPYAVNVLKLSREDAIDFILRYLSLCHLKEPTTAIYNVEYYVDYAKTANLFPPRLETLKEKDQDLYEIITNALES
jgi:hypothetical protein